ncbi:MAG: hypothetical protein ACLR1T_01070 [Evtepia gabavorous]
MSRLSYDPTHCTPLSPPVRRDRTRAKGYCRMPDRPVVARRRCTSGRNLLSGTRGAGTVFFPDAPWGASFAKMRPSASGTLAGRSLWNGFGRSFGR